MFERHVIRLSALALSATVTLSLLSGIDTLARSEHAGNDASAGPWAASAPTGTGRPDVAQRAPQPRI